jgi:outer membrane protein assembly factor BamB/tRNA A-37 threonylcarbamoyl transferase component Bud32
MEPLAAGDPQQAGPYRLRARLGAGGMGQVFLGYSPAGRAVAVKLIHRELARDPEFRTRFRREVAAARAVSGAYTAPVTAAGPDDDPPWLATAFVPGPALAEAVAEAGPLPAEAVWKLAAGLVEALQAVHAAGLVHRDLKPANVLLALDGPRLIDFGISRALEKTAMTSTGMIVGTPSFMSPEQAKDARVGAASDVFSLGCVLVFAAAGQGPFGSGPQASLLYRIVHAEPALDGVPGGLRELAADCLAKAPEDRPGLTALAERAAAARGPDDGAVLDRFWPAPVAGLIRAHQNRVTREMRDTAGETAAAVAVTALRTTPAGHLATAVPDAAHPAADYPLTVSPDPVPSAAAQPVTDQRDAAQTETAAGLGRAGTAAATAVPAGVDQAAGSPPAAADGPPLPAAGLAAAGGLRPAEAGSAGPGLSRRRMMVGLAAVAGAGLAGAGWVISQQDSPHHPAGAAKRPRPTSVARSSPTASPSSAGSTTAPGGAVEVWSFRTGGIVTGLALAQGRVFAGSTDDSVYALAAKSGARLWAFRTGGPVGSRIATAGGAVYAGSNDNSLYALRASDGARLWALRTGSSVASGIAVAGGTVYAGSEDENLYAVRASDGSKLWAATVVGVTSVAVAGDTVFAGSADGTLHALRASDGRQRWVFPSGLGSPTGLAVAGQVVYLSGGSGTVSAVRASDGHRLWGTPLGGAVNSGLATAAGLVFTGANDNHVHALRASDGSPVWTFRTGGPVASGIAVAGGIVYAGGNDYVVHALRAANGHPVWAFSADGPVESQVAAAGRVAFVGSNGGQVYALTR